MIYIVGMTESGCVDLSSRAYNLIQQSAFLVGSKRFLGFFGDFPGQKLEISSPLKATLDQLPELLDLGPVAFLASGDPLCFGVAALLLKKFGREKVVVIPAPSSMQWACAKIGLSWSNIQLFSAHGRPLKGLVSRLQHTDRLACFTDHINTPAAIAKHLMEFDERDWSFWVCEDLNGPQENLKQWSLDQAQQQKFHPLNIVVLDRIGPRPHRAPILDEEQYAKRTPNLGLITKSEIRAITFANLQLQESDCLWDIGAGSGSVAIEGARQSFRGSVYALECNQESIEHCHLNRLRHKTDNLEIIKAKAPDGLAKLPNPNAVFVGGSKGNMGSILSTAWNRLEPNGRLVVNTVTINSTAQVTAWAESLDLIPKVQLINISRGSPLAGKYIRYQALNPIHCFTFTKEEK